MPSKSRRSYPSDMTNLQWHFIAKIIPVQKPKGRNRSVDLREIANAIHYRWRTGCVWRMLPHDYPPWETVYSYYRDWQLAGILTNLREILIRNRFPDSQQLSRIKRTTAQHSKENPNSPNTKATSSGWDPTSTNPR